MTEAETITKLANPETPLLLTFLANNWLNLLFGLIGVVGTVYGVLSWRHSQKDKRSYKFLFDLAEKNIEKNITEESLKKKKEEVERATSEIESLQEQIKRDIPKEARKAVLKDKLNTQHIELSNIYKNVCATKDELSGLSESAEIPPDLLKEIEKEISPEYLLKGERENLKTYLTVFTTLAAITSAILPREMSRIVAGLFLIAGFGILIQLIRNIFASASRKNQVRIATYGYIVGFIGAAILGIGDIYIFAEYGSRWNVDIGTYIVMGVIAFLALALLFVSVRLYRLKVKYARFQSPEQP